MTKVDIGELKDLIKRQPEIVATVAFAQRIIINGAVNLGDYTSIIIAGSDETTPEIIVSKSELIRLAHESIEKYGSTVGRKWWVTNHDAPIESKRVSGPYTSSADAGLARDILEKFEDNHNYWIEEL